MRGLRFRIEAAAFRLLFAVAGFVPRRALLALGSLAGLVGYALDPRHRRIALENLAAAYGDDLSRAEARRIARRCWRHFGRTLVDFVAVHHLDEAQLRDLVRYEGIEHLREAYGRGRGVLEFTGHFGHWELAGLAQGFLGMPLALVARPLDNPALERLLARLRSRSGNRVVHKRNAVREMMRALREGLGVAIVIDQDARGAGIFVPFFGRPASTTPTLALLALRTGAPLIPTFSVPEPDGRYRVFYEKPLEIVDTGDRETDVARVTAECTAIIERWVRARPELWLWMHRRWKTRPPDEPAPAGLR